MIEKLNEMNFEIRELVISQIERYLDRKISYDQFLRNLPIEKFIVNDEALSELVHTVGHFDDDQDIMEKEPEYRKMMKDEIWKQINYLRQ